jgi:S1-C subfamily serine protease
MSRSRLGTLSAYLMLATLGNASASAATSAAPDGSEAAVAVLSPNPADLPGIETKTIAGAVVKVFATMRYPDPYKPWTKQAPVEATASGVVIEGHRILTNAHVALYASQLQIQANQAGDKIGATVIAAAPGMDLAVLKLDDESFFDTHAPIARADALPQIKDAVLAYGYPTGGAALSITKGIVSRIEFATYNFPVAGLRIQIDAAINPGNSGGAAIAGEKMIGLAFSRAGGDTQNIGYIIPNEEIELFLQDIADGRYDGKPAMYDDFQTLENSALRAYLKLDKSVEGIVVNRPYKDDAAYPLKQWDVITRIADTAIDDQGMIHLGSELRVSFLYRVQQVAQHGTVPLTIIRAGKTMQIQLPVASAKPMLIQALNGGYPPYFVYGPLVFSGATTEFVAGFRGNANMLYGLGVIQSPLITDLGSPPDSEREELVVVTSPLFPDKVAKGYGNPAARVVYSVNGKHVRSLQHLVALLRDLKDEFVVFEFAGHGETLVFSRKEIVTATEEILNDNGVRAQGSADMMGIWQAKGR